MTFGPKLICLETGLTLLISSNAFIDHLFGTAVPVEICFERMGGGINAIAWHFFAEI
jgi:hypothetical protein